MSVIGTLLNALCTVMVILIFIRVAFSWISQDYRNPIYRFTYQATEPLLRPVRNLMPGGGMGGLDFSPMIVSFALLFAGSILRRVF